MSNDTKAAHDQAPIQSGELRKALLSAATDCAHEIESSEVCLFADPGKPGNALSQLGDRLLAAVPAAQQQAQSVPAVLSYKPGTWFEARTLDEMEAFYMSRLPEIRAAAKEHGYAIGLHGSARRDFDLMAMQWRDDASDKDTLARAIADAACGIRREGVYEWEVKPNGRVAVSIPICWAAHDNPDLDKPSVGHIDLSIIEHSAAPTPPAATPAPELWVLFTGHGNQYSHTKPEGEWADKWVAFTRTAAPQVERETQPKQGA